ncbi:MAG: hypothetical protein RQ760_16535, partial [Sedimentisphaerales bacterium]|nr:hypothetical protein [Sedimentisphaerales bacterium]
RTSRALLAQASALQAVTKFGDETTIQGMSFLAQMGLQEDAIKRITPLILDFAEAQGMNAADAFKLVAKSLGSSTNALSRYGITIEGAVGSEKRLESATSALSKAFKGQAEAAAMVGTGALTQFSNLWGDLQERVGSFVARALTPLVKGLGELITVTKKESESLEEQRINFNVLVGAATSVNATAKNRAKFIAEINKQYPEYLGNIDLEKVTNEELLTLAEDVNDQYRERIKLITAQEVYKEYVARLVALERAELLHIKIIEGVNQGFIDVAETTTGTAVDMFINSENLISSQTARLEKNREKQKRIYNQMKEDVESYGFDFLYVMNLVERGTGGKGGKVVSDTQKGEKIVSDAQRVELKKFTIERIDLAKWVGSERIRIEKETLEEMKSMRMEFREDEGNAQFKAFDKEVEFQKQKKEFSINASAEAAMGAGEITAEIGRANREEEIAQIETQRAYELSLVEGNKEKERKINDEFNAKRAEIKTKQAKADKRNALFQSIINTAAGVAQAIPNPFLIAFAALIGGIQQALILAQPIPQFKKGTKSAPGGMSIVGESGKELMITPSGIIEVSGDRAELRDLEKGTEIIPADRTKRIMDKGLVASFADKRIRPYNDKLSTRQLEKLQSKQLKEQQETNNLLGRYKYQVRDKVYDLRGNVTRYV